MINGVTKRIGSIKFSCISPEEIRKMSAVGVITPDTYNDEGFPIEKGLMDLHMGVVEPGIRCRTCNCKVDECPGHFGHIDLVMPVIHVGFVKDIKMLLESTCWKCGRLLMDDDDINKALEQMELMKNLGADTIDAKNYTKYAAKGASKRTVCPHCNEVQKKIKLDKPTSFRYADDKEVNSKVVPAPTIIMEGGQPAVGANPQQKDKMTAKDVRARLEKITDDDLRVLGIDPKTCRPEWMVLTALPVPPVTVRPSITLDSGDRSEDDLTHKLVDVLRINSRLKENRDNGAPQLIVEDLWELLQYHITTYFDNQTSGIPPARHRSGRSLKTLAQRLKGKEGRFRSNLSGKRVNFSARTVISPDPLLSINDVGIPIAAARELTVPVHVNAHNIEQIREMIRYGPEHPEDEPYRPGVNYILRPDGRKIRVNERNKDEAAENLQIDATVERQLIDGDVVLFNRQPSLHRMSMMAHRVKIMGGRTFRFNLCDCPPYNADFDGDEMNLHVLQSDEARAEAIILMQVQENILSPRYGGPIIGAIHDHITGAFLLTSYNKETQEYPRFGMFEAMNILTKLNDIKIPEPHVDENGQKYWYGNELFSVVLPEDFSTTFKSNVGDHVRIRDGKLVEGTIDAKAIGNSKGKIVDRIARDYGSARAAKFINQVTRIALGALMNHGFSTGISDEDIPDSAKREIYESSKAGIDEVSKLVKTYVDGTLNQMPGRSLEETLEVLVQNRLGTAREEAGKISANYLGMTNPAVIMAKTGARGSMLNLSQMAGCVGQQSVRGDRLSRGYGGRTLPHFERGDLGAYAKGFCSNSYKSGLTPTEFFFHAMGGREGLVDTAVRTSRSGYMQRRLVSALEDLKLTQDGSIRNTVGTIVQFKYGEDGIDPAKSVRGKALDMDDLFAEIGIDLDAVSQHVEDRDVGDDYANREDGMDSGEFESEDSESDYDDSDSEYEGGDE